MLPGPFAVETMALRFACEAALPPCLSVDCQNLFVRRTRFGAFDYSIFEAIKDSIARFVFSLWEAKSAITRLSVALPEPFRLLSASDRISAI